MLETSNFLVSTYKALKLNSITWQIILSVKRLVSKTTLTIMKNYGIFCIPPLCILRNNFPYELCQVNLTWSASGKKYLCAILHGLTHNANSSLKMTNDVFFTWQARTYKATKQYPWQYQLKCLTHLFYLFLFSYNSLIHLLIRSKHNLSTRKYKYYHLKCLPHLFFLFLFPSNSFIHLLIRYKHNLSTRKYICGKFWNL